MMFKFDSNAMPIMGVGVEAVDGEMDRVTLREIAEHDLSPRLERVPGVAAVSVEGGLRRQIHVELSKEKIRALDLPVDRIIGLLRSENQNIPRRRDRRRRHDLSGAQPGTVREPRPDPRARRDDAAGRPRLPEGHRRRQGLDRRPALVHAHQRQARRPDAGHEAVGQEHGRDRRRGARRNRAHQPRDAGPAAGRARRQLDLHQALDRRASRSTR